MRKFYKISFEQFRSDFKDYNISEEAYNLINIPERKTKDAAGYDFYSPISFNLKVGEKIKLPTGIKAQMNNDEFLMIVIRSSVGVKFNIRMCNTVGIIDSDYYDNDENEGHIWIVLENVGDKDWTVEAKDRIAQGIFLKFFSVDEESNLESRTGGFGSTDRRD